MYLRPTLLACLAVALAACKPAAPTDASAVPATTPAPTGAETAPPAPPTTSRSAADEVKASMDKFLAARSFHASMHMEGAQTMTNEMDFVAPDRYRMQMTAGTQVIIGDTMYMETKGKRMQVPLPAGTISQWRDPLKIQENKEGLSVEAQGSETIDGQAARKYLVRNTVPENTEFTYWIGDNGLPVQLLHKGESQGKPYAMTLRYSRFDDPTIKIDAPASGN